MRPAPMTPILAILLPLTSFGGLPGSFLARRWVRSKEETTHLN